MIKATSINKSFADAQNTEVMMILCNVFQSSQQSSQPKVGSLFSLKPCKKDVRTLLSSFASILGRHHLRWYRLCMYNWKQWIQQLLRIFGPELIRINKSIKTAQSAVFKKPPFFAVSAAKFWKPDISSASEKAFSGGFAFFLVAQLPPKRGVLVHKNSLASWQRCRHSVEPRALTCPFKQTWSNLSAWSRCF